MVNFTGNFDLPQTYFVYLWKEIKFHTNTYISVKGQDIAFVLKKTVLHLLFFLDAYHNIICLWVIEDDKFIFRRKARSLPLHP